MKIRSLRSCFLNGLSINTLQLNQDGDLEVVFDLPSPQTTHQYYTQVRGTRTLHVYDDEELLAECKRLFDLVRDRVLKPDPERQKVHCDACGSADCCRKYNVLLMEEDVERLAAGLGMERKAFKKRYTVAPVDWSGDFVAQLDCDHDDEGKEKCVFLKRATSGQFRCSAYEHRPQICRDFEMESCDDFVPLEKEGSEEEDVKQVERGAASPR